MRVLLLSRYAALGASSRLRFFQYLPYLRERGIHVRVAPFFLDPYLRYLYASGRKAVIPALAACFRRLGVCVRIGDYDLVWLEKELFPWLPAPFEALLAGRRVPYVVDYDDAIHHIYDLHTTRLVKTILRHKLRGLIAKAATVMVGNRYLADWARSEGAVHVETVPTVIDLERYPIRVERSAGPDFRIGWIGSPATSKYLRILHGVLPRFAQRKPARLVLIGAEPQDGMGIPLEQRTWREEDEVAQLHSLEVGIMPLPDSPWERGKCGYKLIQYMACGLPVVASPVGVNRDIVEHGVNGFLAETPSDWDRALGDLAANPELRRRMGNAGRRKVEQHYSLQVAAPKLAACLWRAAGKEAPRDRATAMEER